MTPPKLISLTPEQLLTFVSARRACRLVAPKRKPRNLTVKALASAWNIPVDILVEELQRFIKENHTCPDPTSTKSASTP